MENNTNTLKKVLTTTGIVVVTAAAATAATIIVMKRKTKTPVSVDTASAFMNMGNGTFYLPLLSLGGFYIILFF